MKDPTEDRAAKIRDLVAIYDLTGKTPGLPLPYCSRFRAAFYFVDDLPDDAAREAVAMAKRIFADAFGAVFGYQDEDDAARELEPAAA